MDKNKKFKAQSPTTAHKVSRKVPVKSSIKLSTQEAEKMALVMQLVCW
ncbi:MAG: hypothetical protein ABJF04_17805 [Reichenbachiella sp.]